MSITYRIVITGVQAGFAKAQVTKALADLFKVSEDRVQRLLTAPNFVVKKGVDLQSAAKYQAALEKVGCLCVVEPESSPLAASVESGTAPGRASRRTAETPASAVETMAKPSVAERVSNHGEPKRSIISNVLLTFGVIVLPFVFSWFLLRKGYNNVVRVLAFSWMVLYVFSNVSHLMSTQPAATANVQQTNSSPPFASQQPVKQLAPINLPPFRVTAKEGGSISVLVSKDMTDFQLADLITGFSCDYTVGHLMEIGIPETTPGGNLGGYAGIGMYVFTDREWAAPQKLKQYLEMPDEHGDRVARDKRDHLFNEKIRAYYFGTLDHGHPINAEGSLGFDDTRGKHPPSSYKRLSLPEASACPSVVPNEENRSEGALLLKVKADRDERERQEYAAFEEKFGKAPEPSPWNGSYRVVERYLQSAMNDPDSLKFAANEPCTEAFRARDGWLVGCSYRGRNAFGGMVKQFNWFTIQNGKVLRMDDESAYHR